MDIKNVSVMDKLCKFIANYKKKDNSFLELKRHFGESFDYLIKHDYITISLREYECDELPLDNEYIYKFNFDRFAENLAKLFVKSDNVYSSKNTNKVFYLGKILMDKEYSIFLCYNFFELEKYFYRELFKKKNPIIFYACKYKMSEVLKRNIFEDNILCFSINKVMGYTKRSGLYPKDLKALLGLRGNRNLKLFDITKLKHLAKAKYITWADVEFTIIENQKLGIKIGHHKETYNIKSIPHFYNERNVNFNYFYKEVWYEFCKFEKDSVIYLGNTKTNSRFKNRLKELRNFLNEFGIKDEPFEFESYSDSKGIVHTKVKRRFKMRRISEEFLPPRG